MRGNIFLGFRYVWMGFQRLLQPSLRPYVIFPILLNMLLISAITYGLSSFLINKMPDWVDYLPSWLTWAYWIALPLAIATLLLIATYFFSTVLVVLASPFNGLLSQEVEHQQGVQVPDEPIMAMIWRTLGRELTKLLYIIPRYIGLLIVSVIPGVNVISPVLWIWFGSWMMAVQYVDYSFDNHGHAFKQVRDELGKEHLTAIGFGFTVWFLMTIPVVNWVVMPAAVIGGTLLKLAELNQITLKPIRTPVTRRTIDRD